MSTVDRTNDVSVTLMADGDTLPRGWRWGRHFSGVGCSGHYAVRANDGYAVEVIDWPGLPSPAAAIRAAIAAGEIPRAGRAS